MPDSFISLGTNGLIQVPDRNRSITELRHSHLMMQCPQCKMKMSNGYIPTGGGIFWYRKEERPDLFPFAQALPATSSCFRRAKLEAYHCRRCKLVLFRYGTIMEEPPSIIHE